MNRIFLTMLFCLGLINCGSAKKTDTPINNSESKNKGTVELFWEWFVANEQDLKKFETDPDRYLNMIMEEGKKVSRGLAFELEPPKNGIINMTISANGNKELFPIVEDLVKQAPNIQGWKFIAFRQRTNPEYVKTMTLKGNGFILEPDKMKFFPIFTGDTLDIIIYTNGVTTENVEEVSNLGFILLDNIIGEYDCVKKVRYYDFQNLPSKKSDLKTLLPLLDLASWIDDFYKNK